jgi:hypothetical protein
LLLHGSKKKLSPSSSLGAVAEGLSPGAAATAELGTDSPKATQKGLEEKTLPRKAINFQFTAT